MSRIPATDKANYKGPLFINFGGPGASGNEKLVALSKVFREMAGAGYDLVTWDPRGTGSTLPALSCYKDVATRQLFQVERMSQKALNGNNTLSELVAANKWLAEGCELFSQKILPFMGTMSTVRDLAHLVDVYGHSKKLSYWYVLLCRHQTCQSRIGTYVVTQGYLIRDHPWRYFCCAVSGPGRAGAPGR